MIARTFSRILWALLVAGAALLAARMAWAGAPLDTNMVERLLKNVVLHRKNSLFYRTAAGAKTPSADRPPSSTRPS